MSAALYEQILVGIFDAPARRIDRVASLIWRGHADGHIDDDQAEGLAEAVEMRKGVLAARRAVNSPRALRAKKQSRVERQSGRQKLRTWSTSGALPPQLRSLFTPGENAVAAVIRAEVRKHGACSLSYAAIAQAAGLAGTTVVKRFVRMARAKGLINVRFRPVAGDRHLTNVITITSREWLAWNESGSRARQGGGTTVPAYQNQELKQAVRSGDERKNATVQTCRNVDNGLLRRERAAPYRRPGAGGHRHDR